MSRCCYTLHQEDCKKQDSHLPISERRNNLQVAQSWIDVQSDPVQMNELHDRLEAEVSEPLPEELLSKRVTLKVELIFKELQRLSVQDGSSFLLIQRTPSTIPLQADRFKNCIQYIHFFTIRFHWRLSLHQ